MSSLSRGTRKSSRRPSRASRPRQKLPETQRFHAIAADVSEPNYAEGVVANVTAWNDGHPPEIVWCLTGLSTPMLWTDDAALEAARYNSK